MGEDLDDQDKIEIFNGGKVVIRELRPEDAEAYYALAQANSVDLEEAEIYVPLDANDVRDKARYAVPEGRRDFCIWAEDGLVGAADLIPQSPGRGEIVYWIDKSQRGKGYAREAVRAITGYAFNELDFHTIRAWVKKTNVASRKTLERDGFIHTDTNSATGSLGYTLSKPSQ